MIVYDFYVCWPARCPTETDAPLSVDADAVLTSTLALQSFKTVSGGRKNSRVCVAASCASFRCATVWIPGKARELPVVNNLSVSRQRKDNMDIV